MVMGDLVERCGEEVVRGCIVPGVEGVVGGWENCIPEIFYLLLLLEKHYGKVICITWCLDKMHYSAIMER